MPFSTAVAQTRNLWLDASAADRAASGATDYHQLATDAANLLTLGGSASSWQPYVNNLNSATPKYPPPLSAVVKDCININADDGTSTA